MKIAYVGNFSQPHCTEVHIAATLEKLGHEVARIQELTDYRGDEWLQFTEGADLFLYTRTWGNMVTLRHLDYLKEKGIPSASYHLDLYVGLKREDGLDNDPFWRTDFVFTPDGSDMAAEVFKAKGINHHYIKPAVFEDECKLVQHEIKNSNGDTYKLFSHDVVFVGGGNPDGAMGQYGHEEWPYRGELLRFLRDTYGTRFHKFGHPQETVRNENLNRLYGQTKVVVGDSLCLNFDHPYYWSDRVYETMGRGGFIVHPYIEGMEEEFTDGETIVFYEFNNWGQLKEKIDYYLAHEDEREKIRLAGHEFVKANATYTNRLQKALDIIGVDSGATAVPTPSVVPLSGTKISLGAGAEPEEGFINVDIVDMEGIDVVHNLMNYPWPFENNSATYIKAKDVIEHMATHLPDGRSSIIAFVEECHRILQVGGKLWVQTPSWDAPFLWIDPTHVRGFDIQSFDFFDPETDFGRGTGFYSQCKFKITSRTRLENGNLQIEMEKR